MWNVRSIQKIRSQKVKSSRISQEMDPIWDSFLFIDSTKKLGLALLFLLIAFLYCLVLDGKCQLSFDVVYAKTVLWDLTKVLCGKVDIENSVFISKTNESGNDAEVDKSTKAFTFQTFIFLSELMVLLTL